MRPLAAAVRPWHPSELARLGRNAVEDPPQAGCLGRAAAAPWRISRRGWASVYDVAGGRGGCRRRTTERIEATGLVQAPPARSQPAPWRGMSSSHRRLLRVSGRHPNGPRRRRRLGRAAPSPRDRTRPDRRSGHAHMLLALYAPRIVARNQDLIRKRRRSEPRRIYLVPAHDPHGRTGIGSVHTPWWWPEWLRGSLEVVAVRSFSRRGTAAPSPDG